jgi:phospholipid/cholesterol/gamma-HCH transport system substrate-binding protein
MIALVLVVLVLFGGGSGYTLKANFLDAGGLVTGDDVIIGPAQVGSVQSIDLTPDGQAQVVMGIDSNVGKMPNGTIARIYENSLSGIANKYVVLQPGSGAGTIPSGGVIPADRTYAQVNLDELFDTLGPKTRVGLSQFIRGQAASIDGKAPQANETLLYLYPALLSTTNVTHELSKNEPIFDSLLVQGAQAMQALASRTAQLSQLVSNTNATMGAIASQSQNLERTLSLLAPTLNHSTSTFAGLRSTLDVLDPLVRQSIPANRRLTEFVTGLRQLTNLSIPTVGQLNALIRNPSGGGDLITLFQQTPALARIAAASFPRQIQVFNDSQPQVDYFREYTPDVVAALTNLGQIGGYFDANGHYARTQPFFAPFGLNGANELTSRPDSLRFQGMSTARTRCPGGAVQPAPDGSSPVSVPGCSKSTAPPGP